MGLVERHQRAARPTHRRGKLRRVGGMKHGEIRGWHHGEHTQTTAVESPLLSHSSAVHETRLPAFPRTSSDLLYKADQGTGKSFRVMVVRVVSRACDRCDAGVRRDLLDATTDLCVFLILGAVHITQWHGQFGQMLP